MGVSDSDDLLAAAQQQLRAAVGSLPRAHDKLNKSGFT